MLNGIESTENCLILEQSCSEVKPMSLPAFSLILEKKFYKLYGIIKLGLRYLLYNM